MNKLIDKEPKPRFAALRYLSDPDSGDIIDQALVIVFPDTKSFTGEEAVEFHLHGGRAVVKAMLEILGRRSKLVVWPKQGSSHGGRLKMGNMI